MSYWVKLWSCPDCAFGFDSIHENEGGGHTCPNCENEKLRKALEKIADVDYFSEPAGEPMIQIARAALRVDRGD